MTTIHTHMHAEIWRHYEDERTQFLEKYTSHFIWKGCKRFYWVRSELETEQNCNILTPTLMSITAFLSRSPVLLNQAPGDTASLGHGPHSSTFFPTDLNSNCSIGGPEVPPLLGAGSPYSILSLTNWTSCHRGYIIIWRPLFFLRASQFRTRFNHSTVKVISWYSSTGCTCYLHRFISYFDCLAGLEVIMQHTTQAFNRRLEERNGYRGRKWDRETDFTSRKWMFPFH